MRTIRGGYLPHLEKITRDLVAHCTSAEYLDKPERLGELLAYLQLWTECTREGTIWVRTPKTRTRRRGRT